jgi:hypothetical protein
VAQSLLECLLGAAGIVAGGLPPSASALLLSAFIAAGQYRDDSFGVGQAALDILADSFDDPLLALGAGTSSSSCSVAEHAVNKEAARVVNALFFVQDRLALLPSSGGGLGTFLDLPEQLARFAVAWQRFEKLSLRSSAALLDESQAHQTAALAAALETIALKHHDAESKAASDLLRRQKRSDLIDGLRGHLDAMESALASLKLSAQKSRQT